MHEEDEEEILYTSIPSKKQESNMLSVVKSMLGEHIASRLI